MAHIRLFNAALCGRWACAARTKSTTRSRDSAHWMSVAIRESVTNAVRHGNKLDPRKRVIVRFRYDAPEFTVVVEDEGEGFNPEKVPDPLAEENLLRASGRGIFFMKNFMDEVSYRFEPNRGTRVTMMKRVNGGR